MSVRKRVVSAVLPLALICAPVLGKQYVGKGGGPTLELEQQMLLFESDIFVGRTDESNSVEAFQSRGLGLSSAFSRWLNGIVPYQFHENLSAGGIQVTRQAIEHWNELSSITLVERDPDSPSAPDDYVEFVTGPGCASWVGRQGYAQEIWVSDFCTAGSMIHEIGHALGLLHEHTRTDRDQYIQIFWENIQKDKVFNFEINTSGTTDLGEYNYNSIMHYGEYFFSRTGERTMQAINAPDDVTLGQRTGVSPGDLAAIDALYGTDLALGLELENTADSSEITFTVSNLHSTGAHALQLEFTAGGLQDSVLSSSPGVSCSDQGARTVCTIAVLPGGEMRQVSLTVPRTLSEQELSPQLSSKTFDMDLSNNGLPAFGAAQSAAGSRSGDTELYANAPLSGGVGSDDSGSGGGSLNVQLLLILLALILLRRLSGVVGFAAVENIRSQHAFACTTASSRRAPR